MYTKKNTRLSSFFLACILISTVLLGGCTNRVAGPVDDTNSGATSENTTLNRMKTECEPQTSTGGGYKISWESCKSEYYTGKRYDSIGTIDTSVIPYGLTFYSIHHPDPDTNEDYSADPYIIIFYEKDYKKLEMIIEENTRDDCIFPAKESDMRGVEINPIATGNTTRDLRYPCKYSGRNFHRIPSGEIVAVWNSKDGGDFTNINGDPASMSIVKE